VLVGIADGSAVELRVVGHASTGDPGAALTVEVGAVRWYVLSEPVARLAFYLLRARDYDRPRSGSSAGMRWNFNQHNVDVDTNRCSGPTRGCAASAAGRRTGRATPATLRRMPACRRA
jgi:hypothetical protein